MIKWVNKHQNLVITLIISLLLFIILTVITYLIYIYGYYDKNKENKILENFNSYKFDRVYNDLYLNDKEYLTTKSLRNMTDLMFNKKNLENIYDKYYQDTNKYSSKNDFINKYYYGSSTLTIKDIKFQNTGKTDILSRRLSKSISYKIKNVYEEETYIGIIKNITFKTLGEDALKIDDNIISCFNECKINKLYSGVHSIEYTHKGFIYYSILLIDKSNTTIYMNEIKNLVAISKNVDTSIFDDLEKNGNDLQVGIYSLTKCNLSSGCPSTNYSYVMLNQDKTCAFYTYITIDKAGDSYEGTYEKENGFLILDFSGHTYSVFDYDTKKSTDIAVDTNIKMVFKINSKTTFSNSDYEFKLKA